MAHGQDAFAERLNRLGETHHQRREVQTATAKAAQGTRPEWVGNLGYPGSIVGACILGLLTVVASRYIIFHVNGTPNPGDDPDITMIIDGALAFGLAFTLRTALHMKLKEHLAAKTVGIWIALTCMHNLVHAYPAAWGKAFSPAWVASVTEMTEPKSFFIRGMSFKINGQGDAEDQGNAKPEIKINRP